MDTNRLFRPLVALLIAAGAVFGLGPLLAPATFASLFGFAGTDVFVYRLAGAATFAYAVGFAAGWRASWAELRIPIGATFAFNAASILACLVAIVAGGAQPVVYVILLASIVFVAGTGLALWRPPLETRAERPQLDHSIATWLTALFAIGTAAALVFGLGPLLFGGSFGAFLGASGADPFVYRQAGAATLGAAVGGALVLARRQWSAARLPALMAVTFNGLSVIAAILEIASSGTPVAYLILAAAGLTTVGMAAALAREGR
jgi:hypothetical protein